MRFFRWLFIAIVILAAIFVGVGTLLPAKVHVEREIVINAAPDRIFPYVNNYRRFNEWSPWVERDPNAVYTFSGAEAGVGAKMSWQSDLDEVGSGSQEIVESVENEKVVTALDFGEMGTADAAFVLKAEGGATKVTWLLDSELPSNLAARWMGLALNRLIGADYEEGLTRLKARAEGRDP